MSLVSMVGHQLRRYQARSVLCYLKLREDSLRSRYLPFVSFTVSETQV